MHSAILSDILRFTLGQRGIGQIEPARHLVGGGQAYPGGGPHDVPRPRRVCERASGESNHELGISGRHIGRHGAQGVDLAREVNTMQWLIRPL